MLERSSRLPIRLSQRRRQHHHSTISPAKVPLSSSEHDLQLRKQVNDFGSTLFRPTPLILSQKQYCTPFSPPPPASGREIRKITNFLLSNCRGQSNPFALCVAAFPPT